MSESTARAERRAQDNGNAAERLPSLDELIGVDEKAETLAAAAANIVLVDRRLEHQRVANQDTPEAPIRGYAPEADGEYTAKEGERIATDADGEPVLAKEGEKYRTYKQQHKLCEKAFQDFMRQADEEEILGKVKELTQKKIKEALEHEAKLRDARIARAGQPE